MRGLDDVGPDTSLEWDGFSLVSLQNICKGKAGIQDVHTISLCSSSQAAASIILVAEEHRDKLKKSPPGERMNDWTYLPGSCGVFARRVEMTGTAGDTRVTRPVVTNLQGVNSFIAPLSFLLVAKQPLSALRPPPSPIEADIHETEVRRTSIWSRSTRGNKLSGKPLQAESWTWVEQVRSEKELFDNRPWEQKALGRQSLCKKDDGLSFTFISFESCYF